jgi:hypothetical protein
MEGLSGSWVLATVLGCFHIQEDGNKCSWDQGYAHVAAAAAVVAVAVMNTVAVGVMVLHAVAAAVAVGSVAPVLTA